MLIALVIILGIVVGNMMTNAKIGISSNTQSKIEKSDPYKELRSDGKHTEEENMIKSVVDKYMFENFGSIFKTTWFDSISGSDAIINKYGRVFIVQSKGEEDKAINYLGGLLSFFNDKTIDEKYHVGKVVLVDKDFKTIDQVDTIKW
jgi:hypothetical protein